LGASGLEDSCDLEPPLRSFVLAKIRRYAPYRKVDWVQRGRPEFSHNLQIIPRPRRYTSRMSGFSLATFLSSLLGSGVTAWLVVRGLSSHLADRWLTRYKSDLDKEFENYRDALEQKRKRVEAELGHRTYVTKTQFDTEFDAVKDIFAALGKLRLSFNGLRPFLDWTPQDERERLRLISARLNHFRERFNVLVDTAESVYPFVPEDIYAQLEICMKAGFVEMRHIEEAGVDALSPKGYDDGAKQHEKFSTAYFAAAKLVREHFKQLSQS